MSDLRAQIEALKRTGYQPLTVDGAGGERSTHFGGPAWLPGKSEWPTCPNCSEPMNLFLQLNAADVPEDAKDRVGSGLVQLFYCVSADPLCEVDCEAYFPFSESIVARRVDPSGEGRRVEASGRLAFAPKQVTGWEPVTDHPNWEEAEGDCGLEYSEGEIEALEALDSPHGGDKLLGWPLWVQGVEYPDCPECKTAMTLLFQIDSEDNVPHMFGDCGTGHLTVCNEHPGTLTFGWACG
jgi:hypothetical protein